MDQHPSWVLLALADFGPVLALLVVVLVDAHAVALLAGVLAVLPHPQRVPLALALLRPLLALRVLRVDVAAHF